MVSLRLELFAFTGSLNLKCITHSFKHEHRSGGIEAFFESKVCGIKPVERKD
jgi:hypothetical protein